jgi:hypothetical protein
MSIKLSNHFTVLDRDSSRQKCDHCNRLENQKITETRTHACAPRGGSDDNESLVKVIYHLDCKNCGNKQEVPSFMMPRDSHHARPNRYRSLLLKVLHSWHPGEKREKHLRGPCSNCKSKSPIVWKRGEYVWVDAMYEPAEAYTAFCLNCAKILAMDLS